MFTRPARLVERQLLDDEVVLAQLVAAGNLRRGAAAAGWVDRDHERRAGYFLRGGLRGADRLQQLLRETPEDCAVLWRGTWRGCLEVAPHVLYPRLLVAEHAVQPGATSYKGRQLATGSVDGQHGVLVLVGERPADKDHLTGTYLSLVLR